MRFKAGGLEQKLPGSKVLPYSYLNVLGRLTNSKQQQNPEETLAFASQPESTLKGQN